ncbi:MAG: DUF3152 domain-containing protein [Actinomycetes bacterium]
MTRRSGGLFAGRGIALPGLAVTVVTVIVAFALGLGTGWLSGYVPDAYRAWREGPSPSPTPSVSASPEVDVSLPPLEPITRELDEDDAAAGVVTTAVVTRGAGTFTSVPGVTAEVDDAGPVRYVRIDVEDGVTLDNVALVDYVMTTLNDPRGWGSAGRLQFVLTEGAADIRIVFASPHTVASRCPDPHIPATLSGGSATPEPSASASPEPSGSTTPAVSVPCAVQGIVPISVYDWTAGLATYGDNRSQSRVYLLNHGVGHVLGEPDVECESGRASVMLDQTQPLPEGCKVNQWPFRDADTAG